MGERFVPETLDAEDRAFVESIAGIHKSLDALKLIFPEGRKRQALDAMQMAGACLTAAAVKTQTPGEGS